ncbi:deoxynucleoside kinase [Mycoplasma leonicaptivi]|uniref:deoxynucleoside kinase n=1 Tax=Mycoplasma leonicaptivi TaxID=36742 RepID=UPI0004864997|nr:deoxynucleoside kinase [Mycoplasma leonicaptivi]
MKISISGMIGCGKSTLSKALHKHFKNSFLLEEFKEGDVVFNTFLKWVYEQEPNIDIAFQSYIIESLSNSFKKAEQEFLKNYNHKDNFMFLDRFNVEHFIFAAVTLDKKPKKYLEAFEKLFDHMIDLKDNPDFAIFLDANFEVIKQRILKRGRKVEIDNFKNNENYFYKLHLIYKNMFVDLCDKYKIKYKIIDTNNKTDKEVLEETISILKNKKSHNCDC